MDWGFLTPIYNLGSDVGAIVYNAGASVGKSISTPPPAQNQQAPQANPVTVATQQYNQNFNVATPGYTDVPNPFSPQPTPPSAAQPIKGIAIQSEISPTQPKGVGGGAIFTNVQLPLNAPSNQPAPDDATVYMGYGRSQIKIENVAGVRFGYDTGEFGVYQKLPTAPGQPTRMIGTDTALSIGGGGRNAAQSGEFSYTPLTPNIREQATNKLLPGYNPEIISNPEAFSRLGSVQYGGIVQPLDNRVITPEIVAAGYPVETRNFASFVNPQGSNLSKTEAPGIDLPLTIKAPVATPPTKPATLDLIGAPKGMAVPKGGFMGASAGVVGEGGATGDLGLPAPFRSRDTGATPAPEQFKYQSPVGGLIANAMFGSEHREEGVKGLIAGSVSTATAGLVDLSGVWGLTKTEPALEQFRQQKTAQEQTLTGMESYGKATFGTTPEGQIKIDTTNPEAIKFESQYTTAKAQYEGLISTGKSQGLIINQGGRYVENPDLTYKFGEATKWGLGAGAQVRGALGFNKEQLTAYETNLNAQPVPESLTGKIGYGTERVVFGAGKVLSTHPEEIVYGVGAGAIWATGGEVIGGSLAATVEGGGRLAPWAAQAIAVGESPVVRYGVPAAFVGLTTYSATEGFTASASKSLVNIGGTALPLGGMLYGGMGTQAFLRSGFAGMGTQQEQMKILDLRQEVDLRETVDLTQARTVAFGGQEGMTVAERMMIIRQFGLSSEEIAVSRTRGLSLNDILSARAQPEYASVYGLEYPKEIAVTSAQPVIEMYPLEQMQVLVSAQSSMRLGGFALTQMQVPTATPISEMAGVSRIGTESIATRELINQRSYSDVFSVSAQRSGAVQSTKQFSDVFQVTNQIPARETSQRSYRDVFSITPLTPVTPSIPTKPIPTIPVFPVVPPLIGMPFGFGGGGSGGLFGKSRYAFRERFRVGEGIRFGELGFGGKGKGRRMKL